MSFAYYELINPSTNQPIKILKPSVVAAIRWKKLVIHSEENITVPIAKAWKTLTFRQQYVTPFVLFLKDHARRLIVDFKAGTLHPAITANNIPSAHAAYLQHLLRRYNALCHEKNRLNEDKAKNNQLNQYFNHSTNLETLKNSITSQERAVYSRDDISAERNYGALMRSFESYRSHYKIQEKNEGIDLALRKLNAEIDNLKTSITKANNFNSLDQEIKTSLSSNQIIGQEQVDAIYQGGLIWHIGTYVTAFTVFAGITAAILTALSISLLAWPILLAIAGAGLVGVLASVIGFNNIANFLKTITWTGFKTGIVTGFRLGRDFSKENFLQQMAGFKNVSACAYPMAFVTASMTAMLIGIPRLLLLGVIHAIQDGAKIGYHPLTAFWWSEARKHFYQNPLGLITGFVPGLIFAALGLVIRASVDILKGIFGGLMCGFADAHHLLREKLIASIIKNHSNEEQLPTLRYSATLFALLLSWKKDRVLSLPFHLVCGLGAYLTGASLRGLYDNFSFALEFELLSPFRESIKDHIRTYFKQNPVGLMVSFVPSVLLGTITFLFQVIGHIVTGTITGTILGAFYGAQSLSQLGKGMALELQDHQHPLFFHSLPAAISMGLTGISTNILRNFLVGINKSFALGFVPTEETWFALVKTTKENSILSRIIVPLVAPPAIFLGVLFGLLYDTIYGLIDGIRWGIQAIFPREGKQSQSWKNAISNLLDEHLYFAPFMFTFVSGLTYALMGSAKIIFSLTCWSGIQLALLMQKLWEGLKNGVMIGAQVGFSPLDATKRAGIATQFSQNRIGIISGLVPGVLSVTLGALARILRDLAVGSLAGFVYAGFKVCPKEKGCPDGEVFPSPSWGSAFKDHYRNSNLFSLLAMPPFGLLGYVTSAIVRGIVESFTLGLQTGYAPLDNQNWTDIASALKENPLGFVSGSGIGFLMAGIGLTLRILVDMTHGIWHGLQGGYRTIYSSPEENQLTWKTRFKQLRNKEHRYLALLTMPLTAIATLLVCGLVKLITTGLIHLFRRLWHGLKNGVIDGAKLGFALCNSTHWKNASKHLTENPIGLLTGLVPGLLSVVGGFIARGLRDFFTGLYHGLTTGFNKSFGETGFKNLQQQHRANGNILAASMLLTYPLGMVIGAICRAAQYLYKHPTTLFWAPLILINFCYELVKRVMEYTFNPVIQIYKFFRDVHDFGGFSRTPGKARRLLLMLPIPLIGKILTQWAKVHVINSAPDATLSYMDKIARWLAPPKYTIKTTTSDALLKCVKGTHVIREENNVLTLKQNNNTDGSRDEDSIATMKYLHNLFRTKRANSKSSSKHSQWRNTEKCGAGFFKTILPIEQNQHQVKLENVRFNYDHDNDHINNMVIVLGS